MIDLPQVQVLVSTVLSTRVLWHPLLVGVGAIMEVCSLPLLLYLIMGGGCFITSKDQVPAASSALGAPPPDGQFGFNEEMQMDANDEGEGGKHPPGEQHSQVNAKNSRF